MYWLQDISAPGGKGPERDSTYGHNGQPHKRGVILAVIGMILARPVLHLMQAPDSVLGLSALYLRIYFMECRQ